jgi:ABC-type branched-subunit amino acid transport system substrate-binding protein
VRVRVRLRLRGWVRACVQIVMVDDSSQLGNVVSISQSLILGTVTGKPVKLLLGPYSSVLSEGAARVANETGALLMATAAASTSVFADRPRVFSVLPPAYMYLHASMQQLHELGTQSVAFLQEDSVAPREYCQGAVDKARLLNMTIAAFVTVSPQANRTQIAEAIKAFHSVQPDAVVGCTQTLAVCKEFITQAGTNQALPFYVKAMLFTTCITAPEYSSLLGSLGSFVLGTTPWSDTDTTRDDLMNMSAASFAASFRSETRPQVPYQAAAALAGAMLMVNAIEEGGSMEPELVAQQLRKMRNRSVFGPTQFDANRQNRIPQLTVQFDRAGVLRFVNEKSMLFPMPSWKQRFCEFTRKCHSENGACLPNGFCERPSCAAGQCKALPNDSSEGNHTECQACLPGSFSPGGFLDACIPCSPGAGRRRVS